MNMSNYKTATDLTAGNVQLRSVEIKIEESHKDVEYEVTMWGVVMARAKTGFVAREYALAIKKALVLATGWDVKITSGGSVIYG